MTQLKHSKVNKSKDTLSWKKKLVFNGILLVFSLLLVFILEFALRVTNYGKDLSLFKESENYNGYYEINQDVMLRYFTKVINTSPTGDVFLINKPDTCYRIFVFGGSTTRGFPYQEGTAFPRILYYQLQDVFPEKRIEVVNLSASAINSFSYIDMANEVFKYEPDAILVYGGHNEYYGAFGVGSIENGGNARWLKKIRLKLSTLRSFQLVQSGIAKVQLLLKDEVQSEETLMSRIVKDKDIPYNSSLYIAGVEQFEANLKDLIKKAQKNNVPIVLSELVSNIKDLVPLESSSKGKNTAANKTFNKAKLLTDEGKYEAAKKFYLKAKDEDAVRFRAPEDFNEVINKLCKEFALPMVPMWSYFEANSPNGLVGDNLMVDHLHPNIDGYFIMADAFIKTIKKSALIDSNWDGRKINDIDFYKNNWGFTAFDSLIGDLNIKQLKAGWPFNHKNNSRLFLQTYRPNSFVDSMAFKYLISDSRTRHIEDEHMKLARYYSSMGLNNMAFKEYYALIKMHPYIWDLYFDATTYLIRDKQYQKALDLINSAPLMVYDNFYYYMQGTLLLKLEKVDEAIVMLHKALETKEGDANPLKILMPLYYAYSSKGDHEKVEEIVPIIKKYNPNFSQDKPSGKTIQKIETSMEEVYAIAVGLFKKKDYAKALEILLVADDHKASFEVKKLISIIYLKQSRSELAFKYGIEAYNLNPNDHENLANLFILYIVKKDGIKAEEMLVKLENLNYAREKLDKLKAIYKQKRSEFEESIN